MLFSGNASLYCPGICFRKILEKQKSSIGCLALIDVSHYFARGGKILQSRKQSLFLSLFWEEEREREGERERERGREREREGERESVRERERESERERERGRERERKRERES
jgi:hypothetical protein